MERTGNHRFQEDLIIKVNAHISEKWFYNHIKSDNQTLPRIDVLNLLSKYTGYANWDDFVYKNTGQVVLPLKVKKANRYFIFVPLLVISMVAVLFFLFKIITTREQSFTFYDAQTREVITGCQIEIKIISQDESPINYFSDSTGNFVFKTDKSILKLVVSAPYYHTDTITRILKSFEKDQKISLMPNDYALIIHYFSETKVDDWQKRRSILSQILDDKAMIYQVMNDLKAPGMELLNKNEFIV